MTIKRWVMALAAIAMIAAIPAGADDFTGSERQMRSLPCPEDGQSVPANQEPPGPGECDDEHETHYQGYVWTNEVQCKHPKTAVTHVGNVYVNTEGSPGVGVCNARGQNASPVTGRAVIQGDTNGGTAYIDGTNANEPEQARGWARVDVDSSGASVRCGGDGGRMDASDPGPGDDQSACG